MTNQIMDGTYEDFKIIKTRKVAQVIIEIPIERAESWVQMFGLPSSEQSKWVAIARLRDEAVSPPNQEVVKAIQSAGILCKSENFGEFLQVKGLEEVNPSDSESIANGLRAILGINSRTDFHNDEQALMSWNRLKGEYESWTLNQ
ncbi:MAG: hypothetical protein VW683_04015 [Betaproteobacteria bacterium]